MPRVAARGSATFSDSRSRLIPAWSDSCCLQRTSMTFSIAAFDPVHGDLGVAVATRALAVGSVVPWARAGVGAVATQAAANTTFGPRGLELLRVGHEPDEVIARLTADDPYAPLRQLGVVDRLGRSAAFTGARCQPWAGHRLGEHYACQGNILVDATTIDAMADAFERASGDLAHRLLAALQAGDAAGGDRRGRQSAALLVVRKGAYFGIDDLFVNLRVDDHPAPVAELERLMRVWERERGHGTAPAPGNESGSDR
jgi:uncharacterized Ntn-hydrolase superfamily protein